MKKISYNEKNHDTYCILERLMQVLDDEIKVIGNEHSILKQGVSQGYGIYYSLKDNPSIDEHKTIEEVFKIADVVIAEGMFIFTGTGRVIVRDVRSFEF